MDAAPAPGSDAPPRPTDARWLLWGVVIISVVPLLISAARVLAADRFALHDDDALIELRVRDVGDHTPLVGSYQRYGWNQPGPALFYLLAVPYRLLGAQFSGLQVGGLLIAASSIAGIAFIAWRRGGAGLLLWSSVLVAILVSAVPGHLVDPWEPRVLMLVSALLFFLTFDSVAGSDWPAPVAAAVASLLAQAYAVVAPVAIVLAAIAVGSVAIRARRGPRTKGQTRSLAVTAAAVVVLWLPPIIDAIINRPSNLQRAWDFFREPNQVLGVADAYRVVALQFGIPAPWMHGSVPLETFVAEVDLGASPLVPIALLALIGVCVGAARRRSRDRALAWLAAITVVASVLALSRLVGPVFVWIPESTFVVGMVTWLAVGWCGYQLLPAHVRERLDRPLLAALAAAFVIVSAANSLTAATSDPPTNAVQQAVLQLTDAAIAEARAAGGPIVVRSRTDLNVPIGGRGAGLATMALALERHGVDVVVDSDFANRYGSFRAHPEKAVEEFVLVAAPATLEPGARVIASVDPLTPAQRAERTAITAQLQQELPNASLPELQERMNRDPEFRAQVNGLQQIPDLPVLELHARRLRQP
jgi:hypothetical protein